MLQLLKMFYPPILTSALIGIQLPQMIYQNRTHQLPFLVLCPVFYTAYNIGNIKSVSFDEYGKVSFEKFK